MEGKPLAHALPHPIPRARCSSELRHRLQILLTDPSEHTAPTSHPFWSLMKPTEARSRTARYGAHWRAPPKRCIHSTVVVSWCGSWAVWQKEGSRLPLAGSDTQNSPFSGRFTHIHLNFDSHLRIRLQLILHRGFVWENDPLHITSLNSLPYTKVILYFFVIFLLTIC